MDKKDFNRFANCIGTLLEVFGKQLSPLAVQGYFKALGEYTIDQVEFGFSQALVKCKFFPKPVELIEFINGADDPKQRVEDQAEQQAMDVLSAIGKFGSYKTPKFDDPVTQKIVSERFTWGHMCSYINNETKTWFVKEFKAAYVSMRNDENKVIDFNPNAKLKKLISGIG